MSVTSGTSTPRAAEQPGDPIAREAEFLAALARVIRDRLGVESRIAAQFQAAAKSAARGFQESRRAVVDRLENEQLDAAADYADQRRHALSRYQHDTQSIENELAALQQEAAKTFASGEKRALRKLDEVRWEAETLYEASKDLAPKQLEQFERNLDACLSSVRADHEVACELLNQWRYSTEAEKEGPDAPPLDVPASELTTRLQDRASFVATERARLAELRVPPLAVKWVVPWVSLAVSGVAFVVALAAGGGLGGAIVALLLCALIGGGAQYFLLRLARQQLDAIYPALRMAVCDAECLGRRALEEGRSRAAAQQAEVVARRDRALADATMKYEHRLAELTEDRDQNLNGPALRYPDRMAEIAALRDRDLQLAEQARARHEIEIQRYQADLKQIEERYERQVAQIDEHLSGQREAVLTLWRDGLASLTAQARRIQGADPAEAPPSFLADWRELATREFEPTDVVPPAVRVGEFAVVLKQIPDGRPENPQLSAITPEGFVLPALVKFPERASVMFKARGEGRRAAVDALQAMMLRLLVAIPPAKVRFTIIDPTGLGENFAAFMHLADYNEALVSNRIWTEPRHIEQRLADLSEHMENVIQKYLRNEFETIEQYNRDAGEIAEPFRFLVIANFPANFSEAAQRRLLSIAASGARCGVYVLMSVDADQPTPPGFRLAELEQHATVLTWRDGVFSWNDPQFGQFLVTPDGPPPPAQVTALLQAAGVKAIEAGRVEVPFDVIVPPRDEFWASSARSGIDVPLGRAGATRLQALKLGSGTSQHVLVAGKTGSGKSTLLHALVTNIALRYSPDEVELYLVDFKQGVEFKTYATHALPHARVVAIESDREFGVSVLARIDGELKSRADRFRAAGVQDLAGFRDADPQTPMPRVVLIVDEFQEFFVEDDRIAQDAALLLDRLVRQGRAFGIHVLLGSQTLAGAYSLARSTLGQMAVRIALQCSEADAHLILSEDNSAARLLSRAGEAIYNDSNGLIEGNHPFQVVWLGDERREQYLEQVQALAETWQGEVRPQVVFEGNIPADPRRNPELVEQLTAGRPLRWLESPRAWLGEAVAIKSPTAVVFRRQSGSNLLVLGQNEDAALGLSATVLIALSAQGTSAAGDRTRFWILDGTSAGSEQAAALARLPSMTRDPVRVVGWRELGSAVNELTVELDRRQQAPDEHFPPIFVFVYGLQKLRDLRRQEDDFSFSHSGGERPPDPAKQFTAILRDGPPLGIHAMVWCDSLNNLNRAWDRQTLREFEMRVAFQMSVNDSSTFIDTPLAGKLGMFRALFHSEEQSVLEKFRPYHWPGDEWIDWIRGRLAGGDDSPGATQRKLAVE